MEPLYVKESADFPQAGMTSYGQVWLTAERPNWAISRVDFYFEAINGPLTGHARIRSTDNSLGINSADQTIHAGWNTFLFAGAVALSDYDANGGVRVVFERSSTGGTFATVFSTTDTLPGHCRFTSGDHFDEDATLRLYGADLSFPTLRWPLVGPHPRSVNLAFGAEWVELCGGQPKLHSGVDLQATAGEPVFAAHSGTVAAVIDATSQGWAYGVTLLNTEPGFLFTSVYWHLDADLMVGATVNRGDRLGTVANLGTRTHLHFGVRLAPYTNTSNRGALPAASCDGDPPFPAAFFDPLTLRYEIFGDGFETGDFVRW